MFSTASLHPFVKVENRMEGREQRDCVQSLGWVLYLPVPVTEDIGCRDKHLCGSRQPKSHLNFVPVEFEEAIIYRQVFMLRSCSPNPPNLVLVTLQTPTTSSPSELGKYLSHRAAFTFLWGNNPIPGLPESTAVIVYTFMQKPSKRKII